MTNRSTSTYYGAESTESTGASVLGVLRRRILLVLVTILLCGAAAAAFAYSAEDRYETTARLLFLQTVGPELRALGLLPNTPDADNLSADNVATVGSRRVAVAAAAELRRTGRDVTADDVGEGRQGLQPEGQRHRRHRRVGDLVAARGGAAGQRLRHQRGGDRPPGRGRPRAARGSRASSGSSTRLPPPEQRGHPGRPPALAHRADARARRLTGTGSPTIIQPGYVPTEQGGQPAAHRASSALLLGSSWASAWRCCASRPTAGCTGADQVSAAFDAPVLTTVPRDRALKRYVPFRELPFETAEAFRMLQMNLRFGRSEAVRSVLITSARSEEGKTTIAWNLACAAASGGLSVALVEADLRRMCLAERYDLHAEPGLAELLEGEVELVPGDAAHRAAPAAGRPQRHASARST